MKTSTKVVALGAAGLGALWWKKHRGVNSHRVGNPKVPEPRKAVDLTRYLGLWHEVARYEQSFQRGCQASIAEYALRPDGKVSIRNSCHLASGGTNSVNGKAKIVDPVTNAKLKVSFFGPFYTGDYWILDHAEDYSWSIVGEPSGRALWLLARPADPDEAFVAALIQRARDLGYDISMLVRSGGSA